MRWLFGWRYICSLHRADELQQARNSCPLLRSCFIGSCHVGVSKRFSRNISLAVFCHSPPQSLRSFWPAARIESSGSNHFEITKEITEFCPSGLTQSSSTAHARNGCSQSSRFLPQARRIVGSGDESDLLPLCSLSRFQTPLL